MPRQASPVGQILRQQCFKICPAEVKSISLRQKAVFWSRRIPRRKTVGGFISVTAAIVCNSNGVVTGSRLLAVGFRHVDRSWPFCRAAALEQMDQGHRQGG